MELKEFIRQHYLKFLDREPDIEGLEYYISAIKNNKIKKSELEEIFKNSDEGKSIRIQNEKIQDKDNFPLIATYNDIRIKGKTLSNGYRDCEERYDKISKFCKKYHRPISVLDLGAAEGYFTFRLSEEFNGFFAAVEGDPKRKLLDLCKKNDNPNVILLQKTMNLDDLILLKEIQHFDIVIAQSVIHHFNEPFQNVLDVLMSMCSYCFFEHPNPMEGKETKNFERIRCESLDLGKFEPKLLTQTESGLGGKFSKNNKRDLWLLKNNQEKTIDRGWWNAARYEEQFGPGKQIRIKSNFDEIKVEYGRRDEKRSWIHGINLRTFLEYNGKYPSNNKIIDLLDNLEINNALDLGPHNLIFTGKEFFVIDQEEKHDEVNTIEKLKNYLFDTKLLSKT